MTLKRINKTVARRLVEASDEVNVIIAPVKIHPSTFRGLEGYANEILSARAFSDFDSFVEEFTESYCCDSYSGRYPAYYIEDEIGIEYEEQDS